MPILNFMRRPHNELEREGRSAAEVQRDQHEPEKTCPNCHKEQPLSRLWANGNVCSCGYHFRMSARQRIRFLTDKDTFSELFADISSGDPLGFPGYAEKLETVGAASGERDAVICGTAKIGGTDCCMFVMEPYFMMGSMGAVVGEKITRLFEYATEKRMPVLGCTVSGGARMQEGLISLMQMAKTSAAVLRHSEAGLFYLVLLTDPTTGGVTASFAMEGDIIFSEPGATVGFAGARVVEQTTRKALPKGFQTAESLLEHGFVDAILPRSRQREVISNVLRMHSESEGRDAE